MSVIPDSMKSAANRALPLRKRGDLVITPQTYHGDRFWVIKDPVALTYFRLREEEFFLFDQLDGTRSLEQLQQAFNQRFAPREITFQRLQWFLSQLHQSGLVVAGVEGQGKDLLERRRTKRRRELFQRLQGILAIRFRGIDPEPILGWLYPRLKWCFSTPAVIASWLLILAALLLVAVQFDTFQAKLPAFHDFFAAQNFVWLALALGVTKILHEFGHGLSCKHYGGECHEIGVMLLVFTPCLYCNVSDSWLLPNRWHRAVIGLAGIYVELVIASVCTFLWWFTEPGLLNYLCLSTMFVCSVSTILFNGNPLLRYDGYYVLADVAEIPNMWQKSRALLHAFFARLCLGLELPQDPFLPSQRKAALALYGVASAVYRWFVLVLILWFLYTVLEPYRLEILGRALAVAAITALVFVPLVKLVRFFLVPGRPQQVKVWKAILSAGVLAAILAAILYIPVPRRVHTTFYVEPHGAENVYVTVPGVLERIDVEPGKSVNRGERLARLTNHDLALEIAKLRGERDRQQVYVENLKKLRGRGADVAGQIEPAETALVSLQQRLKQREQEWERLVLRAPAAGQVLPPLRKSEPPQEGLPLWSGTPLERENLGSYLEVGTQFCAVGDPSRLRATLVIDQADVEFVAREQPVELLLDEFPFDVISGQIAEVAEIELKQAPLPLSSKAGGELATKDVEGVGEQPLNTSYQAHVPLRAVNREILVGMRGRAKILTGHETLGRWAWRWLNQTFHFH